MTLYPDLVITLVHCMMVDIIGYVARERQDSGIYFAVRVGAVISIILSIVAYRILDPCAIWLIAGVYFSMGMTVILLC